MRKNTLLSLLSLLPLLASGATAQSVSLEPVAGIAVPFGTNSEYMNTPLNFGLSAYISPEQLSPSRQLQIGLSASFLKFDVDIEQMTIDEVPGGMTSLNQIGIRRSDISGSGSLSIFQFGPVLRFLLTPPESKIVPFLQVGASMYSMTEKAELEVRGYGPRRDTTDSRSDAGISLGGGLRINLSESAALLFNPTLHMIFGDSSGTGKYLGVLAGLNFRF